VPGFYAFRVLRDLLLYIGMTLALTTLVLGILASFDVGQGLAEAVVFGVLYYLVGGAGIVFGVCGQASNHTFGQGNIKSVARNFWWSAWWPWFLKRHFNR
jgi:hypothetical protein